MKNQSSVTTFLAIVSSIGLLVVAGCGGTQTAATPVVKAPTAGSQTQAGSTTVTSTPGGSTKNGGLDCQKIVDATFDFNSSEPFLITLAGGGGSILNHPDFPFYVDTAKMRADLVVLSALPDPTDAAQASMMGKPSEAIPQFRQLFDIIDREAKAISTPTPSSSGGASDQQLLDFSAKLVGMSLAINEAVSNSCPNFSASAGQVVQPNAQATPLTASYQIGQTAPVGDLRVTLDKVVTLPGADANLPAAGNRFLFAHVTIQNTGKAAFALNTLLEMHFEDAKGKQYFPDPFSVGLDQGTTDLSSQLDPGAKQSGSVGFQVAEKAGDLVWVFQDFKPNRAVFAVKASDIAAVGTPVTAATEDALRAGASASQTAFVDMALSAAATQDAAGTETPAPSEPTATDVPPQATDTSAPPDETSTPDGSEPANSTDTPVTP